MMKLQKLASKSVNFVISTLLEKVVLRRPERIPRSRGGYTLCHAAIPAPPHGVGGNPASFMQIFSIFFN